MGESYLSPVHQFDRGLIFSECLNQPMSLFCEIIEVTLDIDNGRPLVAASRSEVAQGADQIGKSSRSGTLGFHCAYQVSVLVPDIFFDGLFLLFAL